MPAIDGDIVLADFGGAPVGGGGSLRARPVADYGHDLVERPFEVDRRWARRKQRGVSALQRFVGGVLAQRESHAVAAVAPISGAPRITMARIACAASFRVVSREVTRRWGSAVWSMTPTDQPSGSSQMARMDLPPTFTSCAPIGHVARVARSRVPHCGQTIAISRRVTFRTHTGLS